MTTKEKKPSRYVLEGVWSNNGKVYHRVFIHPRKQKRMSEIRAIVFSDGTCLNLSLRPAAFREKIEVKHGYDTVIDGAYYQRELAGFVRVEDIRI